MTISKKQQFEELIDAMMIEEVAGLDTELKLKLEGLPLIQKRIGILSILDKDRGLFMKILDKINGQDFTKTEHIKNVVEMLRDYVKVGEVEKKTLGEVMTPISLVNDMLDTLPAEVWKNPNLKWLDPCNGCGVFSSVIVDRLMVGLDIAESDEERYRHIVENMLYVGELQPKNMFLHLCAFDPKDEYDLNIYCGGFLDEGFDEHMKNVWGVDKFDVIVMNPPYNTGSNNKGIGHTLWDKFVIKTIDLLNYGGYLSAVHPNGWRNIKGSYKNVQNLLKSKQLIYLELHDSKDGEKTFGATTPYDFYCLKNHYEEGFKTTIKGYDNIIESIDIQKLDFIPNFMFNKIFDLLAKNDEETVEILHSESAYEPRKEWMSNEKNDEFKYPCVYSILKNGTINYKFSNITSKGHFNVSKIICGNGANPTFVTDFEGKLGMTQWAFGLVDSIDNLKEIYKVLNNEKLKQITLATKFNATAGNPIVYPKIISKFRKDFWKEFLD